MESFILTERVAPLQQSFYFTNPSVSDDGRWLWFYCGFPPSPMRTLGAVCLDPANPVIRHYPATQFHKESPMVLPSSEGAGVCFCSGSKLWEQPLEGEAQQLCELDAAYIDQRRLAHGLVTHLTRSADGVHFLLDGQIGNHWFVGVANRRDGDVRILHEFGRHHNHAQFSPRDPDLFLIAQDWSRDPVSGRHLPFDQRTWLMNVSQTRFEPLCPDLWFNHNSNACHEWWSRDGRVCWVDYEEGVYVCDLETRKRDLIWGPRPLCHAHADSRLRYLCADQTPYHWHASPCQVLFYDRDAAREIPIVTGLPLPSIARSAYHIDPHPQFSPDDSLVVYTTTVHGGRGDVAVTPVCGILDRLDS